MFPRVSIGQHKQHSHQCHAYAEPHYDGTQQEDSTTTTAMQATRPRTTAAAVVLAALISPRSRCSSRPASADARTASAVVVLVALIPPRAGATAVRLSRTAVAAADRPRLAAAPPLPQLGCQRWSLHDRHRPPHS